MILQYFFKKENNQKNYSDKIYIKIITKSKDILNNYDYFTIRNYKSSFEIISIIIIFYLKIIKEKKINHYKEINEYLINVFINDLDKSLRENGIGDMSIGKYVKSYVKKFYHRLSKIDNIFNNTNNNKEFIKYVGKRKTVRNEFEINASKAKIKIEKSIKNWNRFR